MYPAGYARRSADTEPAAHALTLRLRRERIGVSTDTRRKEESHENATDRSTGPGNGVCHRPDRAADAPRRPEPRHYYRHGEERSQEAVYRLFGSSQERSAGGDCFDRP